MAQLGQMYELRLGQINDWKKLRLCENSSEQRVQKFDLPNGLKLNCFQFAKGPGPLKT